MDEVLFNVLKAVIMVLVVVAIRYIIPLAKEFIGEKRLELIEKYVQSAVLMAQQVYWTEDGAERKAIVTEKLKELLEAKNISISDDQLDMLIEAAVKTMKIEEGKGITIEAVNSPELCQSETADEEGTVGDTAGKE